MIPKKIISHDLTEALIAPKLKYKSKTYNSTYFKNLISLEFVKNSSSFSSALLLFTPYAKDLYI